MEIKRVREDNSKLACVYVLTYRQAPVTERELHATEWRTSRTTATNNSNLLYEGVNGQASNSKCMIIYLA